MSRPVRDAAPSGYLPQLDGLRAVAVLLVVLYHGLRSETGTLLPGGFLGVDVFFVLSGFLITSLLLKERSRTGRIALLAFYRRRMWRLYPGLVLVSVAAAGWFTLVPTPPNSDLDRAGDTVAGAVFALAYLSSWAYAFGWPTGAMTPAWSLSVEQHFYLLWPLLLLVVLRQGRGRTAAWTAALTCVAAVWPLVLRATGDPSRDRLYAAPDTRASQLLIGCLLAVLLVQHGRSALTRVLTSTHVASAAALVLAAGVLLLHRHDAVYVSGGQQVVALAAAVLIGHVSTGASALIRVLSLRPLAAVGRWSYGIYLWHVPLMLASYAVIGVSTSSRALGAGAAVVVAAASYRYVEQPLLSRFGRRGAQSAGLVVSQRLPHHDAGLLTDRSVSH